MPDHVDANSPDMRARMAQYRGTLTYLDLIRKNKRASAVLVVVMIGFGAVLGVVLGSALSIYLGGARDLPSLVPSAIVGGVVAFLAASASAAWSWYGGASAILAVSGAQEVTKADDPQLVNVVEELAIAAGVPVPRIYLVDDTALNAFATGRDPEHASVAITTGLRGQLNRDELQGVLAHEMSHVRNYDIRYSMLMATMVGVIAFACDAFWRIIWYGRPGMGSIGRRDRGRDGDGGGGVVMIVLVVLGVVLAIIAPIVAHIIQMAYSRQREYLADAAAVELTRNPLGLASALQKLADDVDPLVDTANRGTAHLYVVNPLRKVREARQEIDSMFLSHPPIRDRIARLLALTR